MRFVVMLFVAGCFALMAAHAGPFVPETVPATAAWVVHLDMQRVVKSPVADLLKGTNVPSNVQAFLDRYRRNLGLEPLRDIDHATLFGLPGSTGGGAAVIAGRFKYDQLVSHLTRNPSYRSSEEDGHVIHQWNDQHSNVLYLCHLPPKRMVLAASPELLKTSIATLEGRSPGLARGGRFQVPGAADTLLAGAGTQESLPVRISAGCRYYHFAVKALPDDTLDANAVIAMPDEKTASDSEKIILGLAFSLALTNAKKPAVAALLQYLRVKADRDILNVSFACPIPTAFALARAMAPKTH